MPSIRLIDETGSTNADLAQNIREGSIPTEGDWLLTRRQSAGKGRQGRNWQDGEGNFMGSTCVALREGDPPPASLSFVAAIAAADVIDEALAGKKRVKLKWPNDILIDGAKMSGILLEMVGNHVVVGVGINLVSAPDLPDRKTAKVTDFAPAPDLEKFAQELADRFVYWLEAWREDGLVLILRAFMSACVHFTDDPITVHDADGSSITGAFKGLHVDDGALLLTLEDGSERVIRAGDIS